MFNISSNESNCSTDSQHQNCFPDDVAAKLPNACIENGDHEQTDRWQNTQKKMHPQKRQYTISSIMKYILY